MHTIVDTRPVALVKKGCKKKRKPDYIKHRAAEEKLKETWYSVLDNYNVDCNLISKNDSVCNSLSP